MAQRVRDLMTTTTVTLQPDTPVRRAAQLMRDNDIGDVLVVDGDRLTGLVTDRDVVVRGVADKDNLADCYVRDVCSSDSLVTAAPDDDADEVIHRMRDRAVRRIPVVEGDRPVGMLSIGDAAIEKDSRSALADISVAPGNT